MKRIFLTLILGIFLTGCYSQGVVDNQSLIKKTSNNDAILNFIVVQVQGDVELLLWSPKARVYVDGKQIAKLSKYEKTQAIVSPGKHKISTKWDFGMKHVTLNFEPKKTYYFGIGIAPKKKIWEYGPRATLTQLSKEEWEDYSRK